MGWGLIQVGRGLGGSTKFYTVICWLFAPNEEELLQEVWPTSLWTRLRDSPRGLPLIFEDEF